jgi:hypothetical protein
MAAKRKSSQYEFSSGKTDTIPIECIDFACDDAFIAGFPQRFQREVDRKHSRPGSSLMLKIINTSGV